MSANSKKKQLRRCAVCQKIGHNKSTCTQNAAPEKPLPTAAPKSVNFFVHHVDYSADQSAHVVDLKTQDNAWKKITAAAPEKPANAHYYFHDAPKNQNLKNTEPSPASQKSLPSLFANLHAPAKTEKKPELKTAKKTSSFFSQFKKAAPTQTSVLAAPPFAPQLQPSAAPKHSIKIPSQKWNTAKVLNKKVAAFALVASLIITLPGTAHGYYRQLQQTKQTILDNSTAGIMALQESAAALKVANLSGASTATGAALERFNTALNVLSQHQLLTTLVRIVPIAGSEFKSREKLLLAGQEIALGNSYLLQAATAAQTASTTSLTEKISFLRSNLEAALPNYRDAATNLNAVNAMDLPAEYQSSFVEYKKIFNAFHADLENMYSLSASAEEIFGAAGQRRYILIFQNESEIRPTGGFMGSFAIADIKDGKLLKLDIPAGGTYDLQGQLDTYLEPPTPLLLSNKRWEFQDANWFPDFPTTAQKILWFYRHSRNTTADGVIAINGHVLERLLTLLGPVTDQKRGLTLSADTARATIQQVVENGAEKANHKPKQILADTASSISDSLSHLPSSAVLPLLINLEDALSAKEIQLYFTDEATQKNIASFGWSGQVVPTNSNQDYVLVVNTNIQGEKSDANIRQTITHQAQVDETGAITDTVTIERTHTGLLTDQLYNQTNIDYLRVYVPQGSTLLSAGGFSWPDESKFRTPESWYTADPFLNEVEKNVRSDTRTGTRITSEFGKTAFGNWVITDPGKTSTIEFTYRLPFTLEKTATPDIVQNALKNLVSEPVSYQLIAQRQSGVESHFTSQIIIPNSWQPLAAEGDNATLAKNGALFNGGTLTHDTSWSLMMNLPQ